MVKPILQFADKLQHAINRLPIFLDAQPEQEGEQRYSFLTGYFGATEGYKREMYDKFREILAFDTWMPADIGEGVIASRAAEIITFPGNNLIDQKFNSRNYADKIIKNPEMSDEIIYDIYKSVDEKKAFENAINFFGARYELLGFFFYLKDRERFLPIRPQIFKSKLECLGLEAACTDGCTWENYKKFISEIELVRDALGQAGYESVELIDAHSFVWCAPEICKIDLSQNEIVLELKNEHSEEEKEKHAKSLDLENLRRLAKIASGRKTKKAQVNVTQISRNPYIAEYAKRRANGICQLCKQPAPFSKADGTPYLETHHIKWLADGGEDSIENTVALCPNCHRRMHVLNDVHDIEILKKSKI